MGTFKKYNLIGGWLCFAIAALTYLLTMEPTASLWDCSEFIATSYKLEVGHPPGAPLFMMIGRLFGMLGGPEHAAAMMNAMSALCSAATIMFLFWSITHLARRSFRLEENELSMGQTIAILGAGLVGALAYAFTDTFWFSAVESEVYAMSSMITAIVFWAILKWENVADQAHANRWLVLIAYLTGLAIGVHLMNLLIIPAIVLIYYFKKYPNVTKWGLTKALVASFLMIVVIMFFIIPKTVQLGAFVDRIFVNSLGAKINLGFTIYVFALFVLLGWGVYYTYKKGRVLANTIALCTAVIMLGFASYASVIIRASANPPMNSNNPSNPYGLLSLLNRDQYGSRPLLRGPYYSSPAIDYISKSVHYVNHADSTYSEGVSIQGTKYPAEFEFFFPRMHSASQDHIQAYESWIDIQGKKIPFQDEVITVPTFGENMNFFFGYQLNFMYWRYFLWNFVGRQNDIQANGDLISGNWMSGIGFIDSMFLGPQKDIPSEMANEKARNSYFFLPFILGIIGLIYQANRDGKNFWVVMSLFIMTGLAIAVYLNMPPIEPRERDYVYAGSFYAFAIWIGLGVLSIYGGLGKRLNSGGPAIAAAATVICAAVPLILAAQNWDDHDRSGRYIARDFGTNYLETTLPNSIIMNFGDNDTFPLWYAQEVENVRPDVRIMNLSYLASEWYIDQMKYKYNESEAVPFSIPQSKYTFVNEWVTIHDIFKRPITAKQAIDFFVSEDQRTKATYGESAVDYIPAKELLIPVNKQNAIGSGIVRAEDADLMLDTLRITIDQARISRSDLMLIDLLANFDWKRPLYFTAVSSIRALGLQDYLQMDGFAYRLMPIDNPVETIFTTGMIDTEYLYDNVMEKYRYGNFKDPKVYADYFSQLTVNSVLGRTMFARLAEGLTAKGDTVRAVEVLDRALEEFPVDRFRHTYQMAVPLIRAYYNAGEPEKANALLRDYARVCREYLTYFTEFRGSQSEMVTETFDSKVQELYMLFITAQEAGEQEVVQEIGDFFVEIGLMDGGAAD